MDAKFYVICAVFAIAAYLVGGINAAIVISKLKYNPQSPIPNPHKTHFNF